MTMSPSTAAVARKPLDPQDVGPRTLLGLSTSLKPGQQRRSAARGLLRFALDSVAAVGADVALVDLHDHPVPFFAGQLPHECTSPDVMFLWNSIDRCGGVLMAVPAYWAGVSGVWKNCIDVLCGPVYDLPDAGPTVFGNKPVGLVVVGADDESAQAGAMQALAVMRSTGAEPVLPPLVVANPRRGIPHVEELSAQLIEVATTLVHLASRAGDRC